MRQRHLGLLACPACLGELALVETSATEGDHVLDGTLACAECEERFRIAGGVPRLVLGEDRREELRDRTAARFGYEWNRFADFDLEEERASLETWFAPRSLQELEGLTVLDAGCGMGRHAVLAAAHGVRDVVGIDLGDAVDAAFRNTRHLPQVCIAQGDLYHPPVADSTFDAAYSIGVLHHVPEPAKGFAALAPKVKAGGWFQVWLYGREGNGWIVHLVNPMRRFTSRLPLPWVEKLSAALAAVLHVATRTVYRLPLLGSRLPYASYCRWLRDFSFPKIHAIVFDHLLTPVAYYLRRDEVESLLAVGGWSEPRLSHCREMSWGATLERRK